MSLYGRYVLPRMIDFSCATKPIRKQREKVVPSAAGRVLEIGVGSGLNFAHYDGAKITTVFGLDPSPELMAMAHAEAERVGIVFEALPVEAGEIPLENAEVDSVLVTYTLCSITDLNAALAEMRRVLKPAGRLLFCEHGAAPDRNIYRWQKRLTPLWRRIAGGCRLDRDMPAIITEAGFAIDTLDQMYLPGTWRVFGYNSWGSARPR